jgi:hypothetical protein
MRVDWSRGVVVSAVALAGCAAPAEPPAGSGEDAEAPAVEHAGLKDALSFHASYDRGADADYARGDGAIYTAPSYRELEEAVPGLAGSSVRVAENAGRFGGALEFAEKNDRANLYEAAGNVAYAPEGWSGTVSFWLQLDPANDLEPGFCDPIQITDSGYDDAAVWVDFTRENPRQFRLGVFGDSSEWNPEKRPPEEFPAFTERLVVVHDPPFRRGTWTHVVITWSGLGSEAGGSASLYLDGVAVPDTRAGIAEAFTWDERGTVRLGLSYVGLFDELALFDRALDSDEVAALHALDAGVAALRP